MGKYKCNFCGRKMIATALSYQSNQYCNHCFNERAESTQKQNINTIDEPEETMINISLKRLDELVQELTDKMELGANSTMYKNAFLYGVIKLHDLLKLEAK